MKYYPALKKKETLPYVTTWVSLEDITLSAMSHMQKDKNDMTSLCGL